MPSTSRKISAIVASARERRPGGSLLRALAMGARIRVLAGGISQIREIAGGGSYLSQSDLRANFGLGSAARADLVEVSWPSGAKQSFKDVPADKFWQIVESDSQITPQNIQPKKQGLKN